MSTLFAESNLYSPTRHRAVAHDHQSSSWLSLLHRWLTRSEILHQRASLRDIADNPHLLRDLGLTREEALEQANRPFWR
jgi:uncharacterized protein YjiS (DUF1127 family)